MEPVSLSVEYRRADYVRAVRFYLRKSTPLWWDLPLLAAVLLLVGVLFRLFGFTPMVAVLLTLMGLVLAVKCIVYLYLPGYQFDHTPQLRERCMLHFSVEDIGIHGTDAAAVVPWRYYALWSSQTDYYLIQNRQSYLILPRACFDSQADQIRFEQIAQAANPNLTRKEW